MHALLQFIREVFSEDDGSGSFSRVATFFCVIGSIAWVSYLIWKNHMLPDFTGVIGFNSSLYGLNRAHSVVQQYVQGKNSQNGQS